MSNRSRFFRYDHESGKVVEVQKTVVQNRPRYPLPIETLAVHPKDIGEHHEALGRAGIPTDFRRDGSPIVEDAQHYKKVRKFYGYHQRNGFES